MLLHLLACYEHAYEYVAYYWTQAKHYMRKQLGPEPQQWYLLGDGQVIPSTTNIPDNVLESTYVYDSNTRHITVCHDTEPIGRYRPLYYIAMSIEYNTYTADASDWLGEIRCNPVPIIPVKQLLQLWMYDTQTYVPTDGTTKITVTTNTGEEEVLYV